MANYIYGQPPEEPEQHRQPWGQQPPMVDPNASQSPQRPSKSRTVRISLALFALGVSVLIGVVVVLTRPNDFDMTGTVTILESPLSSSTLSTGEACEGTGGYSDIYAGAGVTVYGPKNHIVGVGELVGGVYGSDGCTLSIQVDDVTGGLDYYQVQVAGENRGRVTFPEEEARNGGVGLTVGG